jgi:hypothetical protein
MPLEERIFTLGEAKNLIPRLETLLAEIQQLRKALVQIYPEIQKVRERITSNGGSPQGGTYIKALQAIFQRVEQIQEMGVLVKDLDKGLCDFPFMRDGRVVYLCWKLGEEDIGWWHETHTGYAGRQPLDDHF